MIQQVTISFKTNKDIQNISKEVEVIKKQIEVERKNTITEINSVGGLNSKVEITEDRISEPEVRAVEFTQSQEQRENGLGKIMNRASGNLWDNNKRSSIHIISVQKEREKKILKEDLKK